MGYVMSTFVDGTSLPKPENVTPKTHSVELAIRCCVELPTESDSTGIPVAFLEQARIVGATAIGVGVFLMSFQGQWWTAKEIFGSSSASSYESIEDLDDAIAALANLPWFETKPVVGGAE